MARDTFKIEWDGHEYEHKERSQDWFWAVGVVAVALAIVAIIFSDVIFAILILLSAFSLSLFINRPPETVHVVLNEKGITIGKVQYQFSTLHSFWIDEEHPHQKILLRSQKLLMPLITVPIGTGDIDRIQKTLVRFIPEEFHRTPVVEKLLEYLGF
jgi:hypothetical protein